MTTHPAASSGASPPPADGRARWPRGVTGYALGCVAGGVIGWAIDSALTSDPYAGVRIGVFVGGLSGALVGGGTGWAGIGMTLCMVLCSAAGAGLGLALWNPGPDSFLMFVPAGLGGVAGAFAGLVLAAAVLRSRRKAAAATPDQSGR